MARKAKSIQRAKAKIRRGICKDKTKCRLVRLADPKRKVKVIEGTSPQFIRISSERLGQNG